MQAVCMDPPAASIAPASADTTLLPVAGAPADPAAGAAQSAAGEEALRSGDWGGSVRLSRLSPDARARHALGATPGAVVPFARGSRASFWRLCMIMRARGLSAPSGLQYTPLEHGAPSRGLGIVFGSDSGCLAPQMLLIDVLECPDIHTLIAERLDWPSLLASADTCRALRRLLDAHMRTLPALLFPRAPGQPPPALSCVARLVGAAGGGARLQSVALHGLAFPLDKLGGLAAVCSFPHQQRDVSITIDDDRLDRLAIGAWPPDRVARLGLLDGALGSCHDCGGARGGERRDASSGVWLPACPFVVCSACDHLVCLECLDEYGSLCEVCGRPKCSHCLAVDCEKSDTADSSVDCIAAGTQRRCQCVYA